MHREGLIGDYDYAYLFIPRLPFTRQTRKSAPFFGLDDRVPVVLALILGFQHALAMLAGGESTSLKTGLGYIITVCDSDFAADYAGW